MLRETMAKFGMDVVDNWWMDLDEPARRDVIQLWREAALLHPVVACVEARFRDEMESEANPELWHDDFYEYLVNHEIYLLEEHEHHICTQHSAARAEVKAGAISSRFECPFFDVGCPMRKILALSPGKSVNLRIGFRRVQGAAN